MYYKSLALAGLLIGAVCGAPGASGWRSGPDASEWQSAPSATGWDATPSAPESKHTQTVAQSSDYTTKCVTWFTDTSAPFSTKSFNSECTSTDTQTKTSTITLSSGTTTVTSTSTVTASTSTLTATDTSTSTTTTTSTATETDTETATSTTSAAFTPVQSSLPGSTYSGSGGAVSKRDISLPDLDLGSSGTSSEESPESSSKESPGTSSKQYPREVWCFHETTGTCVSTVLYTTTTSRVTPSPSTTITTQTTTLYPSATTTITTTSTETESTSTTTTATTTTTTTITASVTASCSPDNFADTFAEEFYITGIDDLSQLSEGRTADTTALGCCQTARDLGIYLDPLVLFVFDPQISRCNVYDTDTCPSQDANTFIATTSSEQSQQVVVGNLICGEINGVLI